MIKDFIKDKKVIIILFVIVILILSFIIYNFIKDSSMTKDEDVVDDLVIDQIQYIEEWNGKLKDITDFGDYFIIKNIVNKYYLNYSYMYTDDNSDNYFSKVVCNLLAEQYLKDNDINAENIKEKIQPINQSEIYILSAYSITNFQDTEVFIVDCLIRDIVSSNLTENRIVILCNTENQSFRIYPSDYVEKLNLGDLEIGKEYDFGFDINFEVNRDNIYGAGNNSKADYAKDMFEKYRKLMLYAPEKAYEFLTDDQKNNKYSTYEIFNKFIEDNRNDIFLMAYADYELEINDNETVYKIYDKKDKFYITLYVNSVINVKYQIEKYI